MDVHEVYKKSPASEVHGHTGDWQLGSLSYKFTRLGTNVGVTSAE